MHRYIPLLLAVLSPATVVAEPPNKPVQPKYEYRREHDPNGIGKFYLGREIAMVMGHEGIGWLERPEREKEEQPAKLLSALKLKPGQVVADIGAGSGYYTFKFAEAVGRSGKVYAVDIQKEMLDTIRKKMKQKKVENIIPHLGKEADPRLPEAAMDVIVMVDVYHEFKFPYEMTSAMAKSLKPGGRLVFVEFRLEDPQVPIKLVHKMSEKQVIREMSVFPEFRNVETSGAMPWQHVIIFEKSKEQ